MAATFAARSHRSRHQRTPLLLLSASLQVVLLLVAVVVLVQQPPQAFGFAYYHPATTADRPRGVGAAGQRRPATIIIPFAGSQRAASAPPRPRLLSRRNKHHHQHHATTNDRDRDEEDIGSCNLVNEMNNDENDDNTAVVVVARRTFLQKTAAITAILLSLVGSGGQVQSAASAAVVQAVGSGESNCRDLGNCLETGELDGAVGWSWGGKERCDPADPQCGPSGRLRDDAIVGQPVPSTADSNQKITHVVGIQVNVGREESGVLKLGLYGRDAPGAVGQLVDFFSTGLSPTAEGDSNFLGAILVPVTLERGGVLNSIVPGQFIDFGVPSQSAAFARSRGTSKAGDGFVPQPPAPSSECSDDRTVRAHDAAGLISVPARGLGNNDDGYFVKGDDDEAYRSTFCITTRPAPSLDKRKNRRVVGQVLDAPSMAFLERLGTLPTKRGIKGVIPGQDSGPPLIRVTVGDVAVSKVVVVSGAPSSAAVDNSASSTSTT